MNSREIIGRNLHGAYKDLMASQEDIFLPARSKRDLTILAIGLN